MEHKLIFGIGAIIFGTITFWWNRYPIVHQKGKGGFSPALCRLISFEGFFGSLILIILGISIVIHIFK